MSRPAPPASGVLDLKFTFVVKEAKQYVTLVDATPVLEDGEVRAHQLLPVEENSFSNRVVFAFAIWKFNTTETNNCLDALANSAGIAPDANYFRHHQDDLVIETGGLSFQNEQVPACFQDVFQTFSVARPLDAEHFYHRKDTWFDMLRTASAMKLS